MKLDTKLASIITGTALVSALVITIPQVMATLPATEVSKIAKQFTVLINGQNPGSGVIVAKDGNTYYVLTAEHVVHTEDEYTVKTPDDKEYPLKYSTVKKLPGVDLAVVQFTSDKNYSIAKLANSDQMTEGATVYIAGFPNPGKEVTERLYQQTPGEISARPKKALSDGYALIYDNWTRAGMSGGPILDADGRVVGIHGRADAEPANESGSGAPNKNGRNLGIPIDTFLSLAPKAGIKLALQIENSRPTDRSTAVTAPNPNIPSPPLVLHQRIKPIEPTNVPQTPVCAGSSC